jgi:hypothetical protein
VTELSYKRLVRVSGGRKSTIPRRLSEYKVGSGSM